MTNVKKHVNVQYKGYLVEFILSMEVENEQPGGNDDVPETASLALAPTEHQPEENEEAIRSMHKSAQLESLKTFYEKIISVLFLDGKGIDEPVAILSNSEFNVFPLLQTMVAKEYKVSAERFWHLVRHNTDPPRETWRPRVQRNQVKSLSDTRYPSTVEEWATLESILEGCSYGLEATHSPEQIVTAIKKHVDTMRHIWKGQRRVRGQKRFAHAVDTVSNPEVCGRLSDLQAPVVPDSSDIPASENNHNEYKHKNICHTRKQYASIRSTSSSEDKMEHDKMTPATLVVGGKEYTTTLATLSSVPGSFFSKLILASTGACDFFIDRSDRVFEHILTYLRAKRYGECVNTLPLTSDVCDLELLDREAIFYNLPELSSIVQQRLKRTSPDLHLIALETPFVEQNSLLQEILNMHDKANALLRTKMNASPRNTTARVLSHNIFVDSDMTEPGKKRAKLVLTMECQNKTS